MRRYYYLVSNYVETALSFGLLGWQVAIPWLAPHFATQDGPSHLYGATAMRDLVLHHSHTVYAPWYTIQRTPLPNWTASLALAGISAIAGPDRAERLFASSAILIGFLAIAYCVRALSKGANPWTPLANFLLQTWFLWLGFYNFYLGMALAPFAIGYHAKHARQMNARRAAALTGILLAIFATHLIPALVAALAVVLMTLCVAFENRREIRFRDLAPSLVATLPVCTLAALYALQSHDREVWAAQALSALRQFPMHVFVTASGPQGEPKLLRDLLMGCIILAVFLLRKEEWKSPRGGLILAAATAFILYLFLPDEGFGGGAIKIRFAWVVFFLGGIAAIGASRLSWVRGPLAICAAFFLAYNFTATVRTLRSMSAAAADYLAVAEKIPQGATFVRLRYATPRAPDRFGYANAGRDPLLHLDAFAAATAHAVDLSDYEAPTRTFPLVFKKAVDAGQQSVLWAFEAPDTGSARALLWLSQMRPGPIDYVLVIGDENAPAAARQGIHKMLESLAAQGSMLASSASGWIRLYRNGAPRGGS
jgi:hypothetical protein